MNYTIYPNQRLKNATLWTGRQDEKIVCRVTRMFEKAISIQFNLLTYIKENKCQRVTKEVQGTCKRAP